MTLMTLTGCEPTDAERIVVRLLRRYVACQQLDEQPLRAVADLGRDLGMATPAVAALAGVFQRIEDRLGRPLVAECCCNPDFGTDERAVLALLALSRAAGVRPGAYI